MASCLPYEVRIRIYESEKRKIWADICNCQAVDAYAEYDRRIRELAERLCI